MNVVRIKRSIDDVSPPDNIVLTCKRPKTEPLSVFRLSGTVNNADEVRTLLSNLDEAKLAATKHRPIDLTEKSRQEVKEAARDNRFKIVSLSRDVDNARTLIDVEKETADPSSDSVFDIYVANMVTTEGDSEFGELMDDYDDYGIAEYSDYFGMIVGGDEDSDDDSEDSNAENFYTNDYPDEEDCFFSDEEKDLRRRMAAFGFDDDPDEEGELSSDDGRDPFGGDSDEEYLHSLSEHSDDEQ